MKVIEPLWDITGHEAMIFRKQLGAHLDKGVKIFLFNMNMTRKIDGLGISIFENLLERGAEIQWFNVDTELRSFITITGHENILRIIINETSKDAAISVFEKQLTERQSGQGIRARRFPRVSVSLPTEFKYHPVRNGDIAGRAHIINMSEGGLFMSRIEVIDMRTGSFVAPPALKNQEFHDITFRLNGSKKGVKAKGICVREQEESENHSAGISFLSMNPEAGENIRSYISEAIGSGF